MTIYKADMTLAMLAASMEADGGNAYRAHLRQTIPEAHDAYKSDEDGKRSHLGASVVSGDCARALWYGFRWVQRSAPAARMLRLWNRGHLEEARIIALLRSAGLNYWQYDPHTGKQFRVADHGGHYGGSTDGASQGYPEMPSEYLLTEIKTHALKYFTKLVSQGVRRAMPKHYGQMQVYMDKLGFRWGIYFAVNKNDDDIYAEFVPYDQQEAHRLSRRAHLVITSATPLPRLRDDPTWYQCKFCDFHDVCHKRLDLHRSCRTCQHAVVADNGWRCGAGTHAELLSKEQQLTACDAYAAIANDD